jgi:hypothetical protein
MAYDLTLAERVRKYLSECTQLPVVEKKMFGGLAFLVNEKMCVNVSGQNLMCRFDPARKEEMAGRVGYLPMIMRRKLYEGYCYVEPIGFKKRQDFEFWINISLEFNHRATSSIKK